MVKCQSDKKCVPKDKKDDLCSKLLHTECDEGLILCNDGTCRKN